MNAFLQFDQAAKVLGFVTSAVIILTALVGFVWYVVSGRKNIKTKEIASEAHDLAVLRAEKIKDLQQERDELKEEIKEIKRECDSLRRELKEMTSLYLKHEARQSLLEREFGLFYDEATNTFKKR